jgi:hypothetical protein
MQLIMEVAGAINYFSMLNTSWSFADCSLIGFGWYVLLYMEKGKKRQATRMNNTELLRAL